MLRTLLAGILAVSVVAACRSGGDAPTIQPGVAAGTIVDLAGTVTATRGTVVRALTVGAEISGDDVIETGAASHVAIVLAHNNVRWELGAGKREQVGTSMAWTLARQDRPSLRVDEETSAAGRHGEKTAATSGANAHADQGAPEPQAQAAEPPARDDSPVASPAPAPERASSPQRATIEGKAKEEVKSDVAADKNVRDDGRARDEDPTSPAVPQKSAKAKTAASHGESSSAPSGDGGGGKTAGKEGLVTNATSAPARTTVPLTPEQLIRRNWERDRKALAACLQAPHAKIAIRVSKGVIRLDGPAPAVTDATRTCFQKITSSWQLPPSSDAALELDLAK